MLDLSIVIVSYNTRDILDACLASLAAAGGQAAAPDGKASPDVEIIVVDNGSSDESVDMVRRRYPSVRLIETGENVGFSRGCNEGMRVSRGRYILLLNSDTVILDGAPASMLAFMDTHPAFGACGPLILNSDGSVQTSCFAFTTVRDILFESLGLTRLLPQSPLFNRRGLGGFDRRTEREVDWVSGACLMVRQSVLETVGLLDEGFFMYGEELDWCQRMKRAGLRVAFFPGARVVHAGRSSSQSSRGKLAPKALAGRLRYIRKYHGERAALAVRTLTVVGMLLRLAVLPVRVVMGGGNGWVDVDWYVGLLRAAITPAALEVNTNA